MPNSPGEEPNVLGYRLSELAGLHAVWDLSRSSDDDAPDENVIELDGESFVISDAQVEIITEAEVPDSAAEVSEENNAIEQSSNNFLSDLQALPGHSGEVRNDGLVKNARNVFQILEENCGRNAIKTGQRKPRARVERACIPSSSMNINARKNIIDLKAEKAAETERKKLLRERKKDEKWTSTKRTRAVKGRSSFLNDGTLSTTISDFSDESTPPTTPEKAKRKKFNRHMPGTMRILSSDSE